MSIANISNFNYGLDARRSNLSSVLGVLETFTDGHITEGGEIEKRHAFVPIDMSVGKPEGVTILGVVSLKDSFLILGDTEISEEDEETWLEGLGETPVFTYQALIRKPADTADSDMCDTVGTPNYCALCEDYLPDVKATSVIHSTVYEDKAWVLAGMEDGTKCAFYDGVAVGDINYMGRVLPTGNSTLKMFCQLVKAMESVEDYTADLNDEGTGIIITGTPGRDFQVTSEVTGSLCSGVAPVVTKLSETIQPYAGKKASGFFQIQDGLSRGSINRITSIMVGSTELLSADVNYTQTPEVTAAEVVTAINAYTETSGFNASNQGNVVVLYANDMGTTLNQEIIKVTVAGTVMIGKCSITFSGTNFTLSSIKADGVELISGFTPNTFPDSSESLSVFVGRVATKINLGTGTHGYVALARGDVLKLSKQVTQSDPPPTGDDDYNTDRGMITVEVNITPVAGGTGGVNNADQTKMSIRTDLSSVVLEFDYFRPSIKFLGTYVNGKTSVPIKGIVIGGTPPYNYLWFVEQNGKCSIVVESPNVPVTHLRDLQAASADNKALQEKNATLFLEVTDSTGTSAQSLGIPLVFVGKPQT